MKFILSYAIGFIIFLAFTCLFTTKGFRDRVFISFLWFFWIGIAIVGMICSILDAFIHNCSIEESAEKIFDKKIFNWLDEL